jgi:hypothetical protein
MREAILGAALLILILTPVRAGPSETHTGLLVTKHFDVHYQPWSRAGAAVERDSVMAERDFVDICRRLDFAPKCRFKLFLYDDEAELQRLLKMQAGGASFNRQSHVPAGNDQTR